MTVEIQATARANQGTGASRRLRNAGRTPAIVYGGNDAPLAIELDHNTIWHALHNEAFVKGDKVVVIDGKTINVKLADVQWHPYKQQVLHVDFQRV